MSESELRLASLLHLRRSDLSETVKLSNYKTMVIPTHRHISGGPVSTTSGSLVPPHPPIPFPLDIFRFYHPLILFFFPKQNSKRLSMNINAVLLRGIVFAKNAIPCIPLN